MQINAQLTDHAVLQELGERLRRTRLERNLSQVELAVQAGVDRKAVQRVEAGEPVGGVTLVRLLRGLDLLDALDRLVPEPEPSPIELLRLHGKRRQRASGRRGKKGAAEGSSQTADGPWRWGDEAAGDGS